MSLAAPTPRPMIAHIYDEKPASYFSNARHDIVALLETGSNATILELGCGSGGTGRAVLAAGKAGRYVGIELNEAAASVAAESLSEVLVGDVQTLSLESYSDQFDALIISEVLEHLTDPWDVLRKLVTCVKVGGAIYASSPNIAYWGVLKELFLGRFEYRPSGMMDRTHLRWFTPGSFSDLFETSGVKIKFLRPMRAPGWKAQALNGLTGGRLSHLFMAQMFVCGHRAR